MLVNQANYNNTMNRGGTNRTAPYGNQPCGSQNQNRTGQAYGNQSRSGQSCGNQNQNRTGQAYGNQNCSLMERRGAEFSMTIPTGDRRRLLSFINEISFAVYETLLYLDTHPDNQEALQYFKKHNQLRNHALKAYENSYGPLVIAVADESCSRSWEWVNQPWPWEGGAC